MTRGQMTKLTEAQEKALKWLARNDGNRCYWHRFGTMEALRRRGLAERYTTHVIRAVYAQQNTTTVQWEEPATKPHVVHEWYITHAARAALKEQRERDDDDSTGQSIRSWKLEVDPGFIFVRMNHGDGFIMLRAADVDAFVEDLRQAQQISVDLLEVKT